MRRRGLQTRRSYVVLLKMFLVSTKGMDIVLPDTESQLVSVVLHMGRNALEEGRGRGRLGAGRKVGLRCVVFVVVVVVSCAFTSDFG